LRLYLGGQTNKMKKIETDGQLEKFIRWCEIEDQQRTLDGTDTLIVTIVIKIWIK
jgi:hypothetical protein